MATLIAYTSPAAGHVFPLVPGLLALQERGHTVHLRTDPALVDTLRAAGIDAEPLDPRVLEVEIDPGADLKEGLASLIARGPFERADLERAIAATGADALLIDPNAYGGTVAAQRSGLPWASMLPSVLPYPGDGIPAYSLGMAPRRDALGRVRDRVLWSVVARAYGKALLPPLNALRAEAGLPPHGHALDQVLAADRVIVMTGDPLEYARTELPDRIRFVGAQLWDPPAETPEWLLEDGDPWVLVTCSTDYQGDERLAATAIEALRDEKVRVLVTLADAHGVAGMPSADNARVERFVPHGPVLERAAAVVCHGGMGIVQKAVAAAVPIVAVPFGRDQPEIARRVVESGAGVKLAAKRLTPERLRAAVREAISRRPGAAAASARLHAASGPERLADAVEELVEASSPALAR